jgi:hypothetical protein
MALEQEAPPTREGWARCPGCGGQFLREHRCHRPLGVVTARRPEGFDQVVQEARAQAREVSVVQLALTDLPEQCRTCTGVDAPLGADGDCVPCMAAQARTVAGLPPP